MYHELLGDSFELLWEGVPGEQADSRKGIEQLQLWRRK